ncbi:MAG: manganese-dependent inorganic pyrophosphatase [Pseudodesulfovibrio sp.]|uniref:inorganic diphosphatase n=1 Tax=Pseudodesulfovibrio aespoeensis (strain ATCC 700646 / DSM 10631 / Aspo-2) TaxID=643562 RepID=E6VWJ5_PSEA9|nr:MULTISPECIES: manganese-dependent inorganic pyrophosphatase [Pseudodesulfovibrio]MBU4378938.1 manganese-dependent inorganic pyrophosphatase [Pseudomonadota bacterium]ADU62496.1 Inorganic diphosphatase [Pseudodesulfovibrio aespoeensis Aspo-2]MBU4473850.1 manganese-dependent inorganic pyrophosphatase [Pseudomonadota bacterium]MBU4516607.1 manganese-dependent inorganic pyrophosphatase [Pseudomonadota bacterium]MBU4521628.1 manganese-dependent inorganic pyrophosphatase [Pseudomonadota bacterium
MAILVVGHKNPDTDTVASAIAVADLFTKRGMAAKAITQGEIAPETAFVLKKFGLSAPAIVTDATDQKIILVDHTDISQTIDNLDKGELVAVVDHHKLGDVTTSNPLEMWVWPVGCSATVIKNMYDFYNVAVPANIAGIMLCAILSDTVMFKSVTTTDADKVAVEALAKIAGVKDTMALGMEMFKVKSAVDGATPEALVFRDYKDFDMSGKKVGIGQLEVVDLSMLDAHKAALQAEIEKVKADGRHSVFLLLTDIMKEGTEMLIASDDPSVVEKAFGVKATGKSVWLDGVMSRKKQVVPCFEKGFKA